MAAFLASGASNQPGIFEVLRYWRPDPFWIGLIVVAGWLYLRAARSPQAFDVRVPHSPWKTRAFIAGLVVLALGTLSPIQHYGNEVLFIDFLAFLLVTMVAPPLLLVASPLTLAFRVSSPTARRRLRAFYRSTFFRWLTFPITSWLVFAVATYLWQFSGLTGLAARNPIVRDIQLLSLLLVSLLFWMPALCADPVRWRIPFPLRGLYVFVEMTHKALFGAMFLATSRPIHGYFAQHAPAWGPEPLLDQRIAILVLWIGGNLIFAVVLVGIIIRWMAYEGRNSRRVDLRLARERDAERARRAALDQVFQKPV